MPMNLGGHFKRLPNKWTLTIPLSGMVPLVSSTSEKISNKCQLAQARLSQKVQAKSRMQDTETRR